VCVCVCLGGGGGGMCVSQERYTTPSSVRTSASCIAYTSDIFAQTVENPEGNGEDQARAKAIEQTVYE
jgi:hypothetical protein